MLNPDALLGRVLKAKYFPNYDILDAAPCQNSYFTWKSIYSSIDLVKYGLVWRIGNGSQVRVWTDNWIPQENCRMPFTPDLYDIGDVSVNNFILPDGTSWDIGALQFVFWEEDIETILQIPVGGQHPLDRRS